MKTMYRSGVSSPQVRTVEIEKETQHSVFFKNNSGRQEMERKETNYLRWFDAKQDAVDWLISVQNGKISKAHRQIDLAEQEIQKIIDANNQ